VYGLRQAEAMVEEVPHPGPGMAPRHVRAAKTVVGCNRGIDVSTAQSMLLIDFEQAFAVHNDYRSSERDLFKLSLKILSFPAVIGGVLLSAGLVSAVVDVDTVIQLPIIYVSLVISGVLNTIVLRALIVTDKVQTEAKHQVNRLRSLYLHALQPSLPPGWTPVWGSTNPYLETKKKAKAAVLNVFILATVNAGYVGFGVERALSQVVYAPWSITASVLFGCFYLLVQLEATWELIRRLGARQRRSG
jgi:undecaprenyl pyrophosphate phosphatase UppP